MMTVDEVIRGLSLKTRRHFLPQLIDGKVNPRAVFRALLKDLSRLGFVTDRKAREQVKEILEEVAGGRTVVGGRILTTGFRSINDIVERIIEEIPMKEESNDPDSERELVGCP